MRKRTCGALTLLGFTAAMSAAPVAVAEPTTESSSPYPPPSAEIYITGDGRPQPGDDIGVVVRCPYGHPAKAQSPVLEIGKFVKVDSPSGIDTYQAPASIETGTEAGDYPLTAGCGKNGLSTTFTVYPPDPGGDEGSGGTTEPAPAANGRGNDQAHQVARIPKGAPETGGEPGTDPAPLFWGAGLVGLLGLGSAVSRRVFGR
jgi:hypothetical protein